MSQAMLTVPNKANQVAKESKETKELPKHHGGVWGWRNIRAFAQSPPDFFLGMAREHGDICLFRMGPLQMCVLNNPDYVQEVLVTQADKFEKSQKDRVVMGRILGQGLVTSEGDFHKQQRKLSQPAFRKKRIGMYADAMCRQTERMLETWQPGQQLDVAQAMMELTMYIVSETLFHVDVSEKAKRIGDAIEVMQEVANYDFRMPLMLPHWVPTAHNIRASRAKKYLHRVIDEMIEIRRKEEAEGEVKDHGDLLSALLHTKDEEGNGMNDVQLRDELLTLFVAGHETTSNALAWSWYYLSQHPEIAQTLHDELDRVLQGRPVTLEDIPQLPYTQMVIQESMRLAPPVWTLNARCAKEDVWIDGYLIPKGVYVFVSPYVLHRDARQFPNPEKFDPMRFSPEQEEARHRYAYIPFGAGHRVCIGNAFAMMEGTLLLARIAQSYNLVLEPGHRVEKNALITMSPKYGLQMRLEARTPRVFAAEDKANQPAPTDASAHPTTQAAKGCPFHH